MKKRCLVYLGAQAVDELCLQNLAGAMLKKAKNIYVLSCEFVSLEGPYLEVRLPYKIKKTGQRSATILMIPHGFVLAIVQAEGKERPPGFASEI